MTSDLRTAAQQALEAMEYSGMDVGKFNRINAACQALRAALAEPAQEPVAWMDREGDLYKMPEIEGWAPPHTMLYAAPPQRKPLTDEEIEQEYKKGYADGYAAGYDNGDSEGFTRGTDSMVPASLAAWRAETKPLTEAQIYAAIKGIDSLKAVEVARAIEKAHGIT